MQTDFWIIAFNKLVYFFLIFLNHFGLPVAMIGINKFLWEKLWNLRTLKKMISKTNYFGL